MSASSQWFLHINPEPILSKHGTCVYVTSETRLLENVAAFRNLVPTNNIRAAVKTNDSFALWQILAQAGVGADCCSVDEIHLANNAGVPFNRISYYNPAHDLIYTGDDPDHINIRHNTCQIKKLLQGGGTVVLDDPALIKNLEEDLNGEEIPGKIFLRVAIGADLYEVKKDYQNLTNHGTKGSQFGIPLQDIVNTIRCTKLPIVGLHTHIGTMMDNAMAYARTLNVLHELTDQVSKETGIKIQHINLGGGFGIGTGFPSIAEYTEKIKPLMRPEINYYVEPGTAIFADASVLLTRVLSCKGESRLLNIQGGLLKVSLAGFKQEVYHNGRLLEESPTHHGKICGNFCFSGDIMCQGVDTSKIKLGDSCILTNVGAYGLSMSTTFNGHNRPPQVLVRGQEVVGIINKKLYSSPPVSTHCIPAVQGRNIRQEFNPSPLSSHYLHKEMKQDNFTFERFELVTEPTTNQKYYECIVRTEALVDFISQPTFVAICGDAAIIATLHSLGVPSKEMSVVSPKADLSLFGKLPSNCNLKLRIKPSNLVQCEKGMRGRTWASVVERQDDDGTWIEIPSDKQGIMFDITVENTSH